MPDTVALASQSAFFGLLPSGAAAGKGGVIVRDCHELQIATVIARGARETLAARARSAFGLELPVGPLRTCGADVAFIGTGPRTWLALRIGGVPLIEDLQRELGDTAAVADQSDGYAVLRVSGEKARATFEKGLGIDLHPRSFRPGDSAVTTCSHLGAIIWQLDERPTYEVAVFRSLAAAFWHWLSESAAEYGLTVEPGRG
jgi:methylglutamate dehydrogenase subunit D